MAEIGINTGMNIFKENLVNLIGNSQLPIGVIYYMLKDIFVDIEKLYNETLEKEKEEIIKAQKEKEESEKSENKKK